MKIPPVLKTLIGVPVALYLTLRLHVAWEAVVATISSTVYIVGRFVLYVVPVVLVGLLKKVFTKHRKK